MTDHYANSKVVNVTAKDFDSSSFKLKKKPSSAGLIVFHAKWCGFCVQLSAEYKKLAAKSGVTLYSIDADLPGSSDIFAHFSVSGFPTIKFMSKDGKVSSETYMGDRSVDAMMKHIKSSGMSGGGKKKKVVKKAAKKCTKGCSGKCSGGKCKKVVKKCKCKGKKCVGGQCKKAQKGGNLKKDIKKTLKKVKKVLKKSLKKVKKMVGGKKKKVRKPSAYNKHVSAEMKKGKSMAQSAASWKLKK